jgi:hypothetical protein
MLSISPSFQPENVQRCPIVAPDFWNAEVYPIVKTKKSKN